MTYAKARTQKTPEGHADPRPHEITDRFASKVRQLRDLGFSEGLPMEDASPSHREGMRLVSGRIGVAVLFSESASGETYTLVALTEDAAPARLVATHRWDDVVREVHLLRAIREID